MGKISRNMMVFGPVLAVLGGLCIVTPSKSSAAIGLIVGVLLILAGALRLAFSSLTASWGSILFRVIASGLAIVAGVIMVWRPEMGAEALAIVAILFFILDGIVELIFGLAVPPVTGGGLLALGGAVNIGLGILIWAIGPGSGEITVGLIVGAKLILDGVTVFFIGYAMKMERGSAGGLVEL